MSLIILFKLFYFMNYQISVFDYPQSNVISRYFDLFFHENALNVKFNVIILSLNDLKLETWTWNAFSVIFKLLSL